MDELGDYRREHEERYRQRQALDQEIEEANKRTEQEQADFEMARKLQEDEDRSMQPEQANEIPPDPNVRPALRTNYVDRLIDPSEPSTGSVLGFRPGATNQRRRLLDGTTDEGQAPNRGILTSDWVFGEAREGNEDDWRCGPVICNRTSALLMCVGAGLLLVVGSVLFSSWDDPTGNR